MGSLLCRQRSAKTALVVLDIMHPGVDGLESKPPKIEAGE
jgi:hypothetical protein